MFRKSSPVTFVLTIIVLLLCLGAIACSGQVAESDSDKSFASIRGAGLQTSIDFGVYSITGVVEPMIVPVEKIVGYAGETVTTMVERPYYQMDGKSLLRLNVTHATYAPSDVKVDLLIEVTEAIKTAHLEDAVVVVKISDSKMFGIVVGDTVRLSCRAEPENLAAVANDEPFQHDLETWELDWCRFTSPVVDIEQ